MSTWVFGLILIELLIVSWIDIKTRKISNYWFFVNLALAVGFHYIFPQDFLWEWEILIFPFGWIIMGFVLFLFNIMGAGDSKFLASLFLAVPSDHQLILFEKLIWSTIVVGVCMLTFKIAKDFQKIKAYALSSYWIGLKDSIKSSFSFAPVILLGWILLWADKWF